MLPDVDSVIYLDFDILVLSDLHHLWSLFREFTIKQMLGAAQEKDTLDRDNWYNKPNIRHPFVAPHGINSGVLLMNLTRMRDFLFVEKLIRINEQYNHLISLFDQDLLNIIGYYNSGI